MKGENDYIGVFKPTLTMCHCFPRQRSKYGQKCLLSFIPWRKETDNIYGVRWSVRKSLIEKQRYEGDKEATYRDSLGKNILGGRHR